MSYDFTKAKSLLEDLYWLCNMANKDAFKNGVTDSSGTMDEGDTRASQVLGEVHQFLEDAKRQRPLFHVGDLIFYLRENRVHSAPILSRQIVSVRANIKPDTVEQAKLFTPFGPAMVRYATCHGVINGDEAYATRNELADSLRDPA